MNYKMMLKVLGYILLIIALSMIPPLIIALITSEGDFPAFLISSGITALIGFALTRIPINKNVIKIKEGLAIVTMSWLFASVFGALPFFLSGSIPSFVDALFEP